MISVSRYLIDLDDYRLGAIKTIYTPTSILVNDIIGEIQKLSGRELIALEKILDQAVKENEIWASNLEKIYPSARKNEDELKFLRYNSANSKKAMISKSSWNQSSFLIQIIAGAFVHGLQ